MLSNLTCCQIVKDSRDWVHLTAEFLTYAMRFSILQSLIESAYNSKKESNCQKVIKRNFSLIQKNTKTFIQKVEISTLLIHNYLSFQHHQSIQLCCNETKKTIMI